MNALKKTPRKGSIRGVVTDDHGSPLSDASIAIVHGPTAVPDFAYLSAADGRFSIEDLAPGRWSLRALSTDGARGEVSVDVMVGKPTQAVLVVR